MDITREQARSLARPGAFEARARVNDLAIDGSVLDDATTITALVVEGEVTVAGVGLVRVGGKRAGEAVVGDTGVSYTDLGGSLLLGG